MEGFAKIGNGSDGQLIFGQVNANIIRPNETRILFFYRRHALFQYHRFEDVDVDSVLTRGRITVHSPNSGQDLWPKEVVIQALQWGPLVTKIYLFPEGEVLTYILRII